MATALVLNLPEHGHMNATWPLVHELVRKGERVIYFATEPFRQQVEATGAEFAAYPIAFEPPAHKGGLYSVMAFLMNYAEQIIPALLERLTEDRPDYLLIDSMCVWGNLLHQITDIPAIMMSSVFVPNPDTVSTEEMLRRAYGSAPKEVILSGIDALNTYLMTSQRVDRLYGTQSPDIVEFFANRQEWNIIFTSREFHLAGDSYDDSYRFVGPSIAFSKDEDAAPLFPSGEGPLIYISLGTIFNDNVEFYRTCLRAFEHTRFRVLLSIGTAVDPEQLGPLPDNFRVQAFVPQLAVLEQAALFVTHAGMNSTSEALWHGIPLLMLPQHGDQHLVAGRVAELGAGLILTTASDPEQLREHAERLMEEERFRASAQRIGESFRDGGGYTRAAQEILAFTRKPVAACLQSA